MLILISALIVTAVVSYWLGFNHGTREPYTPDTTDIISGPPALEAPAKDDVEIDWKRWEEGPH